MAVQEAPDEAIRTELSDRQLQAAQLLAQGKSLSQIGKEMNVSPRTARMHLDAVRWKLHIRTRREIPLTLHRLGYFVYPDAE